MSRIKKNKGQPHPCSLKLLDGAKWSLALLALTEEEWD